MNIRKAVIERLELILRERHLAINAVANLSGLTPSTVYGFMKIRKSGSITTLKIICDGLDISLAEFFNHEIFHNLEQEIK